MKRKKKLLFLMVFVLLIGTVPIALAGFIPGTGETVKVHLMDAANPTASPVTYPDGQQYIELNNTYKVGDTFTVWANVTDVTELNLYQVGVTYNDSVLECTGYSEGEFFYRAPEEYRTDPPNQPILADGSGFLGYWNHVAWVLKKPGNVSGTGTLAWFSFRVVGDGVTLIDIMLSGPLVAILGDVYSNDIDFNTIDMHACINLQPAKADQGPQLLLETDKNVYILGENVTIVLSNIGTETIEIGGYPIWEIYTYPEEEPVFPSIFALCIWSLEPGENDTITWDQTNQFTHSPVEAGMYVVRDLAGWGLSAYFEIVPLPGDADGDGKVNVWDKGLLVDAWLSIFGDENFDPRVDFTSATGKPDGKVNGWDKGVLVDHWQEIYL